MKRKTTQIVQKLQDEGLTLALAESITCGLAAHQLTMVRGTTEVLRGAVVCYHPDVKNEVLGVSQSLIRKHTAESQQVTDALAKNLHRVIKADIYAAITGLAAPGGSETKDKPVGTVFFSVLYGKRMHRERRLFRGTPLEIKRKSCAALYDLLLRVL
jgi:PncC family amidohydrolase